MVEALTLTTKDETKYKSMTRRHHCRLHPDTAGKHIHAAAVLALRICMDTRHLNLGRDK